MLCTYLFVCVCTVCVHCVCALCACTCALQFRLKQAFLLHDRLMNCSDRHVAYVCAACGSILSPLHRQDSTVTAGQTAAAAAELNK